MSPKGTLVAATLTLLVACASNASNGREQPLSDAEKRAIAKTVDSLMHAYLDAVAAKNADAVIAYYANDPEFMAYFDATPMNYETIATTVRGMFGGLRAVKLEPVTVSVTVLGRDAAVAGFPFREAFMDTAGRVTPLRGTASWTWKRSGDQWRIIHGDAVHLPDTARSARR